MYNKYINTKKHCTDYIWIIYIRIYIIKGFVMQKILQNEGCTLKHIASILMGIAGKGHPQDLRSKKGGSYQPFRPFGRGTTLLRGLTNHGY